MDAIDREIRVGRRFWFPPGEIHRPIVIRHDAHPLGTPGCDARSSRSNATRDRWTRSIDSIDATRSTRSIDAIDRWHPTVRRRASRRHYSARRTHRDARSSPRHARSARASQSFAFNASCRHLPRFTRRDPSSKVAFHSPGSSARGFLDVRLGPDFHGPRRRAARVERESSARVQRRERLKCFR